MQAREEVRSCLRARLKPSVFEKLSDAQFQRLADEGLSSADLLEGISKEDLPKDLFGFGVRLQISREFAPGRRCFKNVGVLRADRLGCIVPSLLATLQKPGPLGLLLSQAALNALAWSEICHTSLDFSLPGC